MLWWLIPWWEQTLCIKKHCNKCLSGFIVKMIFGDVFSQIITDFVHEIKAALLLSKCTPEGYLTFWSRLYGFAGGGDREKEKHYFCMNEIHLHKANFLNNIF